MGDTMFWIAALAAAALLSWVLGARWGGGRYRAFLLQLTRELRVGGEAPDEPLLGPPETRELQEAVRGALASRGRDPNLAAREALDRVAAYLRSEVAAPLQEVAGGGGGDPAQAAASALGAIEDLAFFLEDPTGERRDTNLLPLVQSVVREYAAEWDVLVKVVAPNETLRVEVDPSSFKDALYLVLHNAGRFGGGEPVEVRIERDRRSARIRVLDRGPGFTAEALEKACDPFYTTEPGGLGLGLPYARRVVTRVGGEVAYRNRDDRGAEVEISLPLAG